METPLLEVVRSAPATRPAYDLAAEEDIRRWFELYCSIRFRDYPVGDAFLRDSEAVPCD